MNIRKKCTNNKTDLNTLLLTIARKEKRKKICKTTANKKKLNLYLKKKKKNKNS